MAESIYWYEHRCQKKKKKWYWNFFFSSLRIMQFLEKLCKMWENIDILNLSQQKEEGII